MRHIVLDVTHLHGSTILNDDYNDTVFDHDMDKRLDMFRQVELGKGSQDRYKNSHFDWPISRQILCANAITDTIILSQGTDMSTVCPTEEDSLQAILP